MENLKIFTNSELGTVRTIENNGNIEFCGSDVAKALGYSNPSKVLNDHCRYVTKRYIPHPQSNNKTIEMTFIPEGYDFLLFLMFFITYTPDNGFCYKSEPHKSSTKT